MKMEYVKCPRGHYYDPSVTASCPTCAKESGIGFAPATEYTSPPDDFGKTEPIMPGGVADPGVTVPITPDFGGSDVAVHLPISALGPTTPDYGKTGGTWRIDDPGVTVPTGAGGSGRIADPGVTIPNGFGGGTDFPIPGPIPGGNKSRGITPVVGWLVCVKGNNIGSDYRIYNQLNHIGRGQHMDICIPGDQHISSNNAAMIAFDSKKCKFYIGPGDGKNVLYVNGEICISQRMLEPYDEIELGDTLLVFVPFCGERFNWNERK